MVKKLIICFDGLPYRFLSKENTPFVYAYAKKNNYARLKTLYAFTGVEFSFFSGKYPDQHDVWLEHRYSPKTSPFKWQRKFKFLGRKILNIITVGLELIKGRKFITSLYDFPYESMHNFDYASKKNIWELELFRNKKYVCYKWPFLIKNGKIMLKLKYAKDSERCNTLISNISPKIDIYSVQLVGLDKIIHSNGTKSLKTKSMMKMVDSLVKKTVEVFTKKFPNIEVYIWSDHGFVDIRKYVDLQKIMPKSQDYLALYGGTSISFWFNNDKIKSKVKSILTKQNCGFILTPSLRKKYRIPTSRAHGELIFAINPDYYIFPNYYQKKNHFKAMHSYPTDKVDLEGIFVTNKKLNKKEYEMVEALGVING